MTNRHYKRGTAMLMAMLLASGLGVGMMGVQAQDLDPYHAAMLELLEEEYNITGGELVLGSDAATLLTNTISYGENLESGPDVMPGNPSDLHPFDYIHVEVTRGPNVWAAGVKWTGTGGVQTGDTGLVVAFMRGETTDGEVGEVNLIFERDADPYDKSLELGYSLTSDWSLVLQPFTVHTDLGPGQNAYGLHLSFHDQWVETTAPIVINYGTKYSAEVLQGMINSGGGTPTVAQIAATPTTGPAPLEVSFDASGSSTAGTITSYQWNFAGLGTASGETATFTFQEQGQYTVTLTITDNSGTQATATRSIMVTPLEGSLVQPLEIPFTEVAPVIDGEREAAWDVSNTVAIANHVADQVPASDEDLSGTASVMWDPEYLYVLYEVNDDALFNDTGSPSGWNTYQDDAVDFYLDGGNTKATSYDLATMAQLEFGYDTLGVTGKGPLSTSQDVYAWAQTETGYNIEARVPWDSFSVAAANGTIIGIEFMINDDDTGGDVRQTKLAWFGLVDEAWQNPSYFGNAILIGQPVSAERGDELPDGFAIESVYPNPFNPSTTVSVQLRELGDYTVRAFNVLGQQVLERTFSASAPGRHEVDLTFDGIASGIYTVNVQHKLTGKAVSTTAVLLK